jgi:hypothetical protein
VFSDGYGGVEIASLFDSTKMAMTYFGYGRRFAP